MRALRHNADAEIVVVGGLGTDFVVKGGAHQVGESSEGEAFLEVPGGKACNQALAAARLGARVALVGKVGRDERGNSILRTLEHDGVDTALVTRCDGAMSGATLIHVNELGQKQSVAAPGANHRLKPADILAARPIIESARCLLVQFEVPLDTVIQAVRIAASAGVKAVFDPAPARELPDHIFKLADLVTPNAHEAEVLTGIEVQDRASARRAADLLLSWGAGAASVQAGDEGDLLVWPGGECFLPRLPVDAVDATGAGDAAAAAYAVALSEERDLGDAGVFASAAAALTTTCLGGSPALPSRAAVVDLLRGAGESTIAHAFDT